MKIENVTFVYISSKCNLKIEFPKNILTIQLCQYKCVHHQSCDKLKNVYISFLIVHDCNRKFKDKQLEVEFHFYYTIKAIPQIRSIRIRHIMFTKQPCV